MRNGIFPALAVLAFASCTHLQEMDVVEDWCEISIGVDAPRTKVFGADDSIANLAVLVFDSKGNKYAHFTEADLPISAFRVPQGQMMRFWAIANWHGDDLSEIVTETQLTQLEYDIAGSFRLTDDGWQVLMTAQASAAFAQGRQNVELQLERVVSEVRVNSLSIDMSWMEDQLGPGADEVIFDGLYLINCVSSMTLGGEVLSYTNRSGNMSSSWYAANYSHQDVGYSHPPLDSSIYGRTVSSAFARIDDSRWELEGTPLLYCLPNPSDGEFFGMNHPWLPRPTRLVASFFVLDNGWFEFPVTIRNEGGVLERNSRYNVAYDIALWSGYDDMDRDPEYMFASLYLSRWTDINYAERL